MSTKTLKRSLFGRPGASGRYEVRAEADRAKVYVYDEIGPFGVTAEQFVKDLDALKNPTVELHLNTPGGLVSDGTAMANAIRNHKSQIEVHIDGMAASMGTMLALAGDEIHMAKGSYFVVHNPWSFMIGDAADMRHEADVLDKIQKDLRDEYADKTGKTEEQVQDWMDAETWFSAQEAKEAGFVEFVSEDKPEKACFDLSCFANVPQAFVAADLDIDNPRTIERVLRDAGLSRKQAARLVAGGYRTMNQRDAGDLAEIADLIRRNTAAMRA